MLFTPTGIKQTNQVEIIQEDSIEALQTSCNALLATLVADTDHNYFTQVSAVSEIESATGPTYKAYTVIITYSYVDINITGL